MKRSILNPKKNKNIYLWTGNGWGKTTSALGVALRAVGHNKKVMIIQFMKGRKYTGEYMIKDKLSPNYQIFQFGTKEFINMKDPSKNDRLLAKKGIEFAMEAARSKPFLLILDEINIAASIGLIDKKEVLNLLDLIPKETTVYLTGRYAPKEFIRRADYVTEIRSLKYPKDKILKSKVGIDY